MRKIFLAFMIVLAVFLFVSNSKSSYSKQANNYSSLEMNEKISTAIRKVPTATTQKMPTFQDQAQEVLEHLPSIDSFRLKTSEEVHFVPKEIIQGGEQIGLLIDMCDRDSNLKPTILEFLYSCARNEGIVEQLRAVCVKHLVRYQQNIEEFPDRVIALAEKRALKVMVERYREWAAINRR